jgi:Fic family protein
MSRLTLREVLLTFIPVSAENKPGISSRELSALVGVSAATVKRHLEQLLHEKKIVRTGQSRATRYSLSSVDAAVATAVPPVVDRSLFVLSPESRALSEALSRPLAARTPVTYQRRFVENYQPNQSSLLPVKLAQDLASEGGMRGQQPAGTYARKVLEPLLIDLSWSSSRLEGNRYSLLATQELFKSGAVAGDTDAVMLLNHKQAIEFMVVAVPEYGLRADLVSNIHSILMRDLLADSIGLGAIRQKVVNISDTTYVPLQVPAQLAELFALVLEKARHIKNPVESAFFLWVNIAYLQPFEDGNKRTSRLTANVPLMLYNCAPLSFLEVDAQDYAQAIMGVYEYCDVSLAVDMFAWTYRRSVNKYKVVLESMGAPDPLRLRHREDLNQAIPMVVQERRTVAQAEMLLNLTPANAPGFHDLLVVELAQLGTHNCARYRVSPRTAQTWIDEGRPQ